MWLRAPAIRGGIIGVLHIGTSARKRDGRRCRSEQQIGHEGGSDIGAGHGQDRDDEDLPARGFGDFDLAPGNGDTGIGQAWHRQRQKVYMRTFYTQPLPGVQGTVATILTKEVHATEGRPIGIARVSARPSRTMT